MWHFSSAGFGFLDGGCGGVDAGTGDVGDAVGDAETGAVGVEVAGTGAATGAGAGAGTGNCLGNFAELMPEASSSQLFSVSLSARSAIARALLKEISPAANALRVSGKSRNRAAVSSIRLVW